LSFFSPKSPAQDELAWVACIFLTTLFCDRENHYPVIPVIGPLPLPLPTNSNFNQRFVIARMVLSFLLLSVNSPQRMIVFFDFSFFAHVRRLRVERLFTIAFYILVGPNCYHTYRHFRFSISFPPWFFLLVKYFVRRGFSQNVWYLKPEPTPPFFLFLFNRVGCWTFSVFPPPHLGTGFGATLFQKPFPPFVHPAYVPT